MSVTVSVDVKQHWTVLRHWSVCPWYVNRHPRTWSSTSSSSRGTWLSSSWGSWLAARCSRRLSGKRRTWPWVHQRNWPSQFQQGGKRSLFNSLLFLYICVHFHYWLLVTLSWFPFMLAKSNQQTLEATILYSLYALRQCRDCLLCKLQKWDI